MPASSSCVLADLREWSGALRGMRPAGGFELVVLDPPWPSRSVRRSGAYETADVLELLPAHVQLLPLLNVRAGALVCVWCTNRKANSDWIVEKLFPHWGLRHIATWFWLKVTAQTGELATGPVDSPHRKPWEPLLIGVAGDAEWAARLPSRHVIVAAPIGHSVKPPLEAVLRRHAPGHDFSAGAKLELFARELHPGWCAAGDQVLYFQSDGWFCAGDGRRPE
jgi:N6-adenosine-specific RNA methylase IME4